jgi:hypothetical protein
MHETTTKILEATSWLSEQLRPIVQTPPLPAVYAADPTVYARANYEGAMQRLADGPRRLLLVGMNPGPHGMAQTGVPFGDVQNARIILRRGIQFKAGQSWGGHKIVAPDASTTSVARSPASGCGAASIRSSAGSSAPTRGSASSTTARWCFSGQPVAT